MAPLLAFIVLSAQSEPARFDEPRLLGLAKAAIIAEVEHRPPPIPRTTDPAAPVFITIEIGGRVRGCRGDLVPRTRSLEAEVVQEARAASQHDPRYPPIQLKELKRLAITVTVVERTEPIQDIDSLKPQDGLVLSAGNRIGVVLPFEGRSPRTRLAWGYRKANVSVGAPAKLERLVGTRFRG